MEGIFFVLAAVIVAAALVALGKALSRGRSDGGQVLRDEFRVSRAEDEQRARSLREEIAKAQETANNTVIQVIGEMNKTQKEGLEAMGKSQKESLEAMAKTIRELSDKNEQKNDQLRDALEAKMKALQEGNEKKLDQMRQTVDEKLQSTLEKRLGESFKIVSKQLEQVQRGLGEMQNLATGVGDLKKVLTNVKTRGTWGEVQLGAILEQILTPDQYGRNVQVRPSSSERVEFAIRLPGSDANGSVWLPIDAKFPQEDYQRLLEAADRADAQAVEQSLKALTRSIEDSAKEIAEKYLEPPATTDFAILFLPTESLYAEVLRQPGLLEKLQSTHRVVIAGPTTLAAILNSLQMGFRTLAIEKRSSEVWQVLAAVKTEFGKFGGVLGKVKRQLNTASNTIGDAEQRTRAMDRKLRGVEELPTGESAKLLELAEDELSES